MTTANQNSFASNLDDFSELLQDLSRLLKTEDEQHDDHCWAWRVAPEYPHIPSATFSGN